MIMDAIYFGYKYEIAQIEKEEARSGKFDKEAIAKLKPDLLRYGYYQLYCQILSHCNFFDDAEYHATLKELSSMPDNVFSKAYHLYLEASYLYTIKNDTISALEKLGLAEDLFANIKLEDRRILYEIIQYKAVIYADMKEYQNTMALKMFKKASNIKLDEVDYYITYLVEIMECLLNLETGHYTSCIKKLLALKKQCQKEKFHHHEARILLYLGEAYRLCDKDKLALKCLDLSFGLVKRHDFPVSLGDIWHCSGAVYHTKAISCNNESKMSGFLEIAKDYYGQAILNYATHYPRPARISVALYDIARADYAMKDYKMCIHILQHIISRETNEMKDKNERLMKSIYTYLALANLKLKNTREALKYIKKAENEYRETKIGGYTLIVDDREDQIMICEFYIEYYSHVNNYKKALIFARQKEAIIINKKNEVIRNLIKLGNMK